MTEAKKPAAARPPVVSENVLREFVPIGRYRVRLVQNAKRPENPPTLDIREYVSSDTFEGFTRRGIRITDRAQMDLLRDVLKEVLDSTAPAP
jgi:hypothetical protein